MKSRLLDTPLPDLREYRIWVRHWYHTDIVQGRETSIPLMFSFRPDRANWPHIILEPATGAEDDVSAPAYEIDLEFDLRNADDFAISAGNVRAEWQRKSGLMSCGGQHVPVGVSGGNMSLKIICGAEGFEIICPETDQAIFAENMGGEVGHIVLCTKRHSLCAEKISVYGLRTARMDDYLEDIAAKCWEGRKKIFDAGSYVLYDNCVADDAYGPPHAAAPHATVVISPTRVLETFEWGYPYLDMTRVADRGDIWRASAGIERFPRLKTGINTLDAAWNIALETFARCSSGEFSLPGQGGLWQGGYFQGRGQGFGVWVRDTAHAALRSGNIIDSTAAGASLEYTTHSGFDNASDGLALPIVGIYDYYLATGDENPMRNSWQNLKSRAARLVGLFDEDAGLIPAERSTSNDAFDEPENGGFALSTEICYMLALRAMVCMGKVLNENEEILKCWDTIEKRLCLSIKIKYWNDDFAYFTSGPEGSEAFRKGFWETSGQEMAVWPKFGIADDGQRKRVLGSLKKIAMNEYGVDPFPYRQDKNHFCGSSWPVWTAGIAAAANRENDAETIMELIAGQTRHAIIHKTFYEATDLVSGRSWRWPGQLWHAAGYVSYVLYGLLGMEYDESGLRFHPVIPKQIGGFDLSGLKYRGAEFDISVSGDASNGAMLLDGVAVEHISPDLRGRHILEFTGKEHSND